MAISPSALTALRTLVFRHVPFLKPQWPSLHWRPKARALRTTSPLVGREKRAAFGNDKMQEVLGPSSLIWFRPELPYQHAPCFLSTAVDERIESSRGSPTSSRGVGKMALPPS